MLPDLPKDPDFLVDSENWEAVMLFCQCSTQWRYGAMGGVIGLDYPGVQVVLKLMLKRKRRAEVFFDVQIMERAALAILNKKAEKHD